MGLIVDELEISTAIYSDIVNKLERNDFIYVSGGNTFFLLQEMNRSGAVIRILQSISISLIGKVRSEQIRYQKTPSKGRLSEVTIMYYLRKQFLHLLGQNPELRITQIIQKQQKKSGISWDSLAS